MADDIDDNYYNCQQSYSCKYLAFNIFQVYRPEIVRRVNLSHIYSYFPEICDQIPRGRESYHMDMFLRQLEQNCSQEMLKKFLDALKKEEYTVLVDLINGDEALTEYDESCMKKIQQNTPRLKHKIDVRMLTPSLWSKKCINKQESEKIMAVCDKDGNIAAAAYLLSVIHRYHKCWYDIFLDALKEAGKQILIEECGLNTFQQDKDKELLEREDKNKSKDQDLQQLTEIDSPDREVPLNGIEAYQESESKSCAHPTVIDCLYERLETSSKLDKSDEYTNLTPYYVDCASLPPPKPCTLKRQNTGIMDDLTTDYLVMRGKNSVSDSRRGLVTLRNSSIASQLFEASQQNEFHSTSETLASVLTSKEPHTCRWPIDPTMIGRPTYEEHETAQILLQLKDLNGYTEREDCQCVFLSKPCKDGSYYIWIHDESRVVMLSVRYAQEWRFFKVHRSKDGSSYYIDRHVFKSNSIREVLAFYEDRPIPEKLSNGTTITVRLVYPWGSGLRTSAMIS